MPVTEKTFEDFVNCKTKAHLNFLEASSAHYEFSEWQNKVFEDYAQKCRAKLCFSLNHDNYISNVSFTHNISVNHQLIFNCFLETKEVQANIQALERLEGSSSKSSSFVPIRFVPREKLNNNDKLLLAYDALVLSSISGNMPPQFGRIIHGAEQKIVKVGLSGLVKTAKSIIKKIIAQQSGNSPPELILNKHCAQCEFHSQCYLQATEKDDLSLLSGMSEKERKREHSKGIFSVAQLSYTFRPRRRSKDSSKSEKHSYALRALAIRERKIHVSGKPELSVTGTPIFLDVEGIPDRDSYYLIGMRFKKEDSDVQYSFWADDPSQEKTIWKDFLDRLRETENPQIIHYGSYEANFLKRMKDRYCKDEKHSDFIEKLISEAINLLSVIYAKIYFPTYSNGLKDIARYLGFQWSEKSASGLNSLMWREKWEFYRTSDLKEKLITYNAEDCEALEKAANFVSGLCRGKKEIVLPEEPKIVYTDTLKRKSTYHFGKNSFSLPELEKINQSAYWDYQREKIFIRSSPRLKAIAPKPSIKQSKPLPVNKIIKPSRQRSCPECKSKSIYKHGPNKKVVRDLKFGRTGVKRWIVQYQYNRYICRKCKATFYSELGSRAQYKNGPDLLAYIIYYLVELRASQMAITNNLNDLFGFHFDRSAINTEKARGALEYRPTYEEIINKILNGKLIHADETRVSLKGATGFVWVVTNMEEVAYFCTDTREGEMIQTMLRDFKGVLVSDFYAAYDSINCPQQKCLIHLMRDLNDDLIKQPFNEELKFLVRQFAELLKPIIETIDRRGLKTYFLRKYKIFVEQFYAVLDKAEFKTEITIKYKKRLIKNRDRLFTFLDYDGIPWNNNNAEHAVKAFVMLCRVIGGTSTSKGISEYLVLLSIYETCKYKGINFLSFLRSGEKSIDSFILKKARKLENTTSENT